MSIKSSAVPEYNRTTFLDNVTVHDNESTTGWENLDPYSPNIHQIYFILNGLTGSAICCLGIIGNIFNIIIFSRMLNAYNSATNIFLLAITVTDLMVLSIYLLYDVVCIALPPKPLIDLYDIKQEHLGTFMYFLYYTWLFPANMFITASNWCTVSVMVFRFIGVYFPLKASQLCTPTRAKIVLIVIMTLSVLTIIPDCFTVRMIPIKGYGFIMADTYLVQNEMFEYIYHISYMETVNSPLPFTICFVLSGLLIRTLKRRQSSFGKESSLTGHNKRQRNQRRISVMLLVIVISFIICTIPAYVWRGMKHGVRSRIIKEDTWVAMRGVADIFLIINHSAKFAIYLLTNIMFRKNFVSLITCHTTPKFATPTHSMSQIGYHSRYSDRRETSSQKSYKPSLQQKLPENGADEPLFSTSDITEATSYQAASLHAKESLALLKINSGNGSTESSSLSGSDGTLKGSSITTKDTEHIKGIPV